MEFIGADYGKGRKRARSREGAEAAAKGKRGHGAEISPPSVLPCFTRPSRLPALAPSRFAFHSAVPPCLKPTRLAMRIDAQGVRTLGGGGDAMSDGGEGKVLGAAIFGAGW